MAYKVYFNGVAREHFLEAALWYANENIELVDWLEKDLDRSLGFISDRPKIYPVVYRDVHMAVLKKFPYNLYYRIHAEEVEVIAFLHHRRDKDSILIELTDG